MDPNKLLHDARRAEALNREATRDDDRERRDLRQARADKAPPAGAGALKLERRQGEWRYYLDDQRVRVGAELELYLNEAIGWVRGTFQWGRRNVSPPTLRVPVTHPVDGAPLGEAELSLPDEAVLRWPS
jgi:hypothetical protein